jgi:hypothetical protein
MQEDHTSTEVVAGLVERVHFITKTMAFAFCALRRGKLNLVTVIGHAATISAGGRLRIMRLLPTYYETASYVTPAAEP